MTQQLPKTTSPKGDGFDYDCEFDEEFDRLASQLCDGFGALEQCSSEQAAKRVEVGGDVKRFAEPKSDAEVDQLRRQGIPANTLKGTKWAVNVWRDWTAYHWSMCHPLDCPLLWPATLCKGIETKSELFHRCRVSRVSTVP